VLIYMEIFDAVSTFAFVFERDGDKDTVVWCVNACGGHGYTRKNQAGDVLFFVFKCFRL
jgi:hypothetical protein